MRPITEINNDIVHFSAALARCMDDVAFYTRRAEQVSETLRKLHIELCCAQRAQKNEEEPDARP